jgi:HSP20 family protein
MINTFSEIDRTFALMNALRRRMFDLEENDGGFFGALGTDQSWPRASLFDSGNELVLMAEVPGLRDKDLNLSLHEEVLTMSGERPVVAPEGATAHRQERGTLRFSRSFTLPVRVEAEKVNAELKDGILKVTLPKHAEAKPRQINVRTN